MCKFIIKLYCVWVSRASGICTHNILYLIPFISITFFSANAFALTDAECLERPVLTAVTMSAFWRDSTDVYTNYDGCVYIASGLIGMEVSGGYFSDWTAVGAAVDGGDTDGGNTDGGDTDGGNTDGGNTDGGNTDGGNNVEFDYDKMADTLENEFSDFYAQVKSINDNLDKIKPPSYDFSFSYESMAELNKSKLTENYESADNKIASEIEGKGDNFNSEADLFTKNIDELLNNKKLTEGGDFIDNYTELNSLNSNIGSGADSPLIEGFKKYFPVLPQPKKCTDISFARGTNHQFSIDCKYIDYFKTVFAFLLYCYTFLSIYDSFSMIMRRD